ncbi:MAG: YkgJ family cysteine cluster protein [Syntrophothermus sp.]
MDLEQFRKKALTRKKDNKLLLKRLSKMDPRKLDDLVHELHDEVFAETDCLDCANCCSTLGPRVTEKDIERIAGYLRIKQFNLIEKYLIRDEEDDYVFRSMPCPFLGNDHYCSIYEDRPKACRDYPHTDRRRFYQILDLTLKNSMICPAVLEILERIKKGDASRTGG